MQQPNTNYIQLQPTMPRTASSNPVTFNVGISTRSTTTAGTHNDHDIRQYLRDVQAQFFKDKKDQQLPDLPLNLYNASIIAMCKCSKIFHKSNKKRRK